MSKDTKYINKFTQQLGNASDFVNHVRLLEQRGQLNDLRQFPQSATAPRYLMVVKGRVPVIDFKHFFAAMIQHLNGSFAPSMPSGEGGVLLLGILNEFAQCGQELIKWEHDSCFSREDLGSNRLGVEFAEILIIKQAERSSLSVANLLSLFLARLQPIPAREVSKLKLASRGTNLIEMASQLFTAIARGIIPNAY